MYQEQRRIRTLVVDDSPTAVHTICSVLERNPEIQVVGTAEDGREALALADTLRPELVLLDVQMPVMNGIEAATEMTRTFPEIRVVMVTAHDSPVLRQICLDSGARGFVPKGHIKEELPIVLHQLFTAVE